MRQFLLSSAIIRSRTAGNAVGSRLGLYFPFPADKISTNNELGTQKMAYTEKKPTEIRAQDSEPLTPPVLDYRIPGTDASLVGRNFQVKKCLV